MYEDEFISELKRAFTDRDFVSAIIKSYYDLQALFRPADKDIDTL